MIRRLGEIIAVWAAIGAAAASAQAPPLGSEFQANTYTTGSQAKPSVSQAANGTSVVVWQSDAQDGDGAGIFGQRFDATGAKKGGELAVNAFDSGRQGLPKVAASNTGFVVVWESDGQDGDREGIFGQRFDAAGAKAAGEFQVNSYTTSLQLDPAVAMDDAGNFVVVWDSQGEDGQETGVFAQRFDAAGVKLGGEFRVNTHTIFEERIPAVACDPSGNFVVVWEGDGDGSGNYGIFGQRYDATGAAAGEQFQINTYTTDFQITPAVSMDARGDFVVVWGSKSQDGDGYGVFGQRFDALGNRTGAEFPVNTYTTGSQASPTVAMDRAGAFVVAWSSLLEDGDRFGVFAQRFDRVGARVGPEFRANLTTADDQENPSVAFRTGQLLAVWTSPQDGSADGVFGRRQALVPESVGVDAHGGGASVSDANGVLEPGERVFLEPAWANLGAGSVALSGTLSGFTGPAGGIYLVNDGTGSYGTLPSDSFADCTFGNGATPCYEISLGGTRPATHWDAAAQEDLSAGGAQVWKLHVGDSFSDVPRSQPFYRKIETLLHAGITTGCGPAKYCPSDAVPRDQMAIFVAKGIAGSGENVPHSGVLLGAPYDCAPGGASLFSDVAPTDAFCKHVHSLAVQNVTLGCGVTKFCPSGTVTRDAMASFVAKAMVAPKGGAGIPVSGSGPAGSYSCDAASPNVHFADVPVSSPFCKHIHFLWAKGVVSGCSPTLYCPNAPVARDAMAKFLANAFGLQLYAP